ncbi:efflux RND transporter periplasmic adaptor subunit [Blastopirellula marina]|uniref:Efflux transporter periplasmic adaptor subunit n=1 Tax=Blastopirellula marina TaxID=124 RepID=A0A2S8F973_9BACT|nr:efflux RND transporter periplasmic adaptor subunit [Blastopirellula marina]PQO28709.1 efflux transporter periplasmic adaptor subunit [Blastopirellula marina]PTL41982.1 efflux RND transporter periplasmic adaptor subunit [Blastopirellula marina]
MTKSRTLFPCFIFAILAVTLVGCGRRRELPKTGPPPVTVAPAIKRQVVDFDEYTGHVEAVSSVDVYAKVSGYLDKVAFEDGALVKTGQLLYLIDKRTYQAEYDQAVSEQKLYEAQEKLANVTLARNEKLVGKGAVSQEAFDEAVASAAEATAQVQASQSDIAAKKVNLDYCTINSPIDGRIDRTYVTIGNLIQSGVGNPTLLTTIVSVDPVYIYFDVDELALLKYIEQSVEDKDQRADGSLKERKIPVEISLADGTIYPHLGLVDFGSNEVNAATGTLTVRAVVPNPQGTLRPGLFTRVKVAAGPPYEAVLVPQRAIGANQSNRFVYVMDDKGNAIVKPVTLGSKQGPLQVVKTGLNEGEQVIVNGTLLVRPDKPVKAEHTTMPEPPPIDKNLLRNEDQEKPSADETKAEVEEKPKQS